ncbi:MAG: polysaccharide deacetylase family protein [Clostridiales Family XIII bacterium]|jgi:uncharacterized repeat protein (TIGR02543 family)|nr:polysaccharide deacetylase family protein [Clostridiales Family XIII bacterium]
METNSARRKRRRRHRLRTRRIVIPGVLIAALLLAGQLYEVYSPTPIDNDRLTLSFATDATPGKKPADMKEVSKGAEVTFYAGDEAVTTQVIKSNSDGGYDALPQAEKEGYDFVGWYTERTGGELISENATAALRDGDTLYARWDKMSLDVDRSVHGLPVLMYHWFYDLDAGDAKPTSLLNNWMEAAQFEEEIAGLKEADYYFPTWEEVYAFVEGEIDLPAKSIVITIDDGKKSFYEYAVPIFEKYDVKGTGFIIAHKLTEKKVSKYSSDNVSLQSHTWDMHDGYGGKGLIQTLPFDEAVADLTSASAILGASDALAYPFGYYDDEAVDVCEAAGIKMAFGTSGGNVYPGMDSLRLPRVRISSNQSAASFLSAYCRS